MIDRPWREGHKKDCERVAKLAQEAFWEKVASVFPGTDIGDLDVERSLHFNVASSEAVRAWVETNVLIVVEQTHLEEVGYTARILDTGGENFERYEVESALCDDAGMAAGEWQCASAGSPATTSDDFRTLAQARAYVALLAAGCDFHEALTFIYMKCSSQPSSA